MAKENVFEALKDSLVDIVGFLKPVPYQPGETAQYETVTFDGTEEDAEKWKILIAEHIKTAKTFEIHCWSDEEEEIALALKYGRVKPFDWKHGTVIEGRVTAEFTEMLMSCPKPANADIGNKLTPFFSIFLDNGFSGEHYGTENHIKIGADEAD